MFEERQKTEMHLFTSLPFTMPDFYTHYLAGNPSDSLLYQQYKMLTRRKDLHYVQNEFLKVSERRSLERANKKSQMKWCLGTYTSCRFQGMGIQAKKRAAPRARRRQTLRQSFVRFTSPTRSNQELTAHNGCFSSIQRESVPYQARIEIRANTTKV